MSGWGTGYNFHCDLIDFSDSPQGVRVRHTFFCIDLNLKLAPNVLKKKNLKKKRWYHFLKLSLSPLDGSNMLALLLLKVHRDVGHSKCQIFGRCQVTLDH